MNLQNNMPDSAPLRDVVVVGSGNVAESLARAVAAAEGLRPRGWPPPISIWSP